MQIGSYTRKNIKSFCNRFQRTKLSRQLASLLRHNAVKGFFRLVPLSCFPRLAIIIRLEFENARFINEITKNIFLLPAAPTQCEGGSVPASVRLLAPLHS